MSPEEFGALIARARTATEATELLDHRTLAEHIIAMWQCIAHIADAIWPPAEPEPAPLTDLAALRQELDALKKEHA